MKRTSLSIKELAQNMMSKTEDFDLVYAVLFPDEAMALTKELLTIKGTTIGTITLEEVEYDNYEKEYYVCLTDDYKVSVERAYHEANEYHGAMYYTIGGAYVFIDEDASSTIVSTAENCVFAELKVKDKAPADDEDCECTEAACIEIDFEDLYRHLLEYIYKEMIYIF